MLVKILPLTEAEKQLLSKSRGRSDIARPIIDMFLKSGLDIGKVDLTDSNITPHSMLLRLRYFTKKYRMPVKAQRKGEDIFLVKLEEKDIPKIG